MEAHGTDLEALYDNAKQALYLETDRPMVLRQVIRACRKGGTVSIPGVYTGYVDKFPIGAAFGKGLTLKMGQTHVHKYLKPLLQKIEQGEIDSSFVISHHLALEDAPYAYRLFNKKQDSCVKIVMDPWANREQGASL
jgi:threonine dehydrogenase-like Zn-dependent dehydrogenase